MEIQKTKQLINAAFYCLLISIAAHSQYAPALEPTAKDIKLTPRWTERYLFKFNPELVKNTHLDQVLSFYYFGTYQDFTVMGMERVKGEDYHQHNTVLIFKNSVLQGYYEELAVFPAGVSTKGIVGFPGNNDVVDNIDLSAGYYPDLVFMRDKEINPSGHAVSGFVSLVGKDKR